MVVEVNGGRLHCEITGEGEPLLWLHGFMGAGPDWKYIVKEAPAGFQQLFALCRAFADTYDDVNFTPPYLATITAQTLIVFGDRDPLYPVSLAFELHAAIPRSYLWVIPNGGHGPVFGDAAPRFAETALSFLRGDWANVPTA